MNPHEQIAQGLERIAEAVRLLGITVFTVPADPEPTRPTPSPNKPEPVATSPNFRDFIIAGHTLAISEEYHNLAQKKRLASFQSSPVIFKDGDKYHYLPYEGKRPSDGRHRYKLPATTSHGLGIYKGELKILHSNDARTRWPHEYARIDARSGETFRPRFKTVNADGDTIAAAGAL